MIPMITGHFYEPWPKPTWMYPIKRLRRRYSRCWRCGYRRREHAHR
jgi:hypothetical protein